MIVRRLDDLNGGDSDISAETWRSRRLLLKKDGMGFSFHDTQIFPGTEIRIWYKHHLEAVYCIAGEGELEDLTTGEKHALEAGTIYALDGNEKHILRTESGLRMICVFNPPLNGAEVHDKDGVYPLVDSAVEQE